MENGGTVNYTVSFTSFSLSSIAIQHKQESEVIFFISLSSSRFFRELGQWGTSRDQELTRLSG